MNKLGFLSALALFGFAAAAHAHDNFSVGINIGTPYYSAPQPVYYAAPPVVYYGAPIVHYRAAPSVVYTVPVNGFYQSRGYGRWGNGWGQGGRGDRCERPHRGWR